MKLNRYRWLPWYWPCWGLVFLLRTLVYLPYRSQLVLGKGIGYLMFYVSRQSRMIAQRNIAVCFPEKSAEAQAQLLKDSFLSLGIGVMETVLGWWGSKRQLESLFHLQGEHYLLEAMKTGRGVLVMGAHYTTIQIAGRLMTMHYPISVMYRPNKIGFINELIQDRMRTNYHAAYQKEEVRAMLKGLRKGEVVWYAGDVSPARKHALFVPFFGKSTATLKGIAQFPRLSNAIVIPVTHFRRADGTGYDIQFFPPLENFPSENLEEDLRHVNEDLENHIRQCPEQYLWVYKRFKIQPPGEPRFYEF